MDTPTAMFNLPRKAGAQPLQVTRPQWEAIKQRFSISPDGADSFEEFCFRVQPALAINCLMLPWCGMWLGIEPDGNTHS
jgi:hypothetical protein